MSKLQPKIDDMVFFMTRVFSSNFAEEIDNGKYECVCGSCETKVSDVNFDSQTQNVVIEFPLCVYSQIVRGCFASEKSKKGWEWILDQYYEDRRKYEEYLDSLVDEDTQELLQDIDMESVLEV